MTPGSYKKSLRIIILSVLVLWITGVCHGQGSNYLAGLRGGISFDGGTERFEQVETFAAWEMPWRWNFYSDWYFRPGVDVSAGWISNQKDSGFVGTLGPTLELHKGNFPIVLEGGSSPTILSRYRFGNKDFGDNFQFTSHIGLKWQVTKQFSLGWRFQHMSNASIAEPNPGVNLEVLSASYTF
jgi:lipid A 3-O-deacylase